MAVISNNILAGASGQSAAAAGYTVERSIRINSADSAYLNRTPSSAGNRKTWTWSGWIKRSEIGSYNYIFNVYSDASNYGFFNFDADKLRFGQVSGGSASYSRTTSLYRDASAWYHIFLAVDTTQSTGSDRIKIYVNGVQQTVFDVTWTPSQNADLQFNNTTNHALGTYLGGVSSYGLDGYFADVHFIDGQALDPTDFGEFDANNVWQPIEYAGTYGTNGFHLDFSDNSSASALGTDSSGNSNDWTVNNLSVTCGNGSYVSNTTGTPYSAGAAINAFDDDDATYMLGNAANSFYGVTFSPGLTGTLRLYASRSTSSDGRLKVNGTEYTSSLPTGFASPSWVTISYPEASITSIEVDRYAPLRKVEVDGVVLVDNAAPATAGCDSLFDSPTNGTQTDTGAGGEVSGNYATWNPLFTSSNSARTTISNGNLDVTSVTTPGNYAAVFATLGISSGKFYWEVTQNNSAAIMLGIAPASNPRNNYYLGESSNEWGYYSGNGTVYSGGSSAASYTQYSTGDVVGIAFDADNGKLFFSLNGTWQGSSDPAAGTNPAASGITTLPQFPAVSEGTASQTLDVSANFGQRAFAYTAPSGFQPLCTALLPDPTIADGSTAMDVALYTGNGGDLDVTGLSFNPDLVWGKARSNSLDHFLQDSVRGVSNVLRSNTTGAEAADGCLASFNSDGFSVNPVSLSNQTSTTYVGWAWDGGSSTVSNTDGSITSSVRANASAGFSIVSYTGTNSDATVGHGLGVTPSLIIVKCRTTATYSTTDWYVFTQPTGKDAFLVLNKPDASASNSGFWGTPNSSTFGVKNASGNNVSSSDDHIAYCFAPVEGYSAFGSYTGNGSSDGPFVYTGFRPRWMLLRNADNTTGVDWILLDTARDTYNIADARLRANTSDQEGTESFIDITSNGFKVRTGGQLINGSGQTVIYAAFAEHPFKTARAR